MREHSVLTFTNEHCEDIQVLTRGLDLGGAGGLWDWSVTLQALPSPDVWSAESRGSAELVFSFSTHGELQVYNSGGHTGAGVYDL